MKPADSAIMSIVEEKKESVPAQSFLITTRTHAHTHTHTNTDLF